MSPEYGQSREDTGAAVRRNVDFSRASGFPRGKPPSYQNSCKKCAICIFNNELSTTLYKLFFFLRSQNILKESSNKSDKKNR